ncbi:MAG: hypothetical protein H6623_06365 [Bdellovibrionaceae bacterium]|nr:hypothetical protein [Pseudobdellovibrionaceae bacterium]
MPNDILKLSDKRVLLSGPIRSYSYEIGYAFTAQGASICFFTDDVDKARRICDTLNDAREIYRHYGRATFSLLDCSQENITKSLAGAIQTINGLDIYIDAMNFFSNNSLSPEAIHELLEKVSHVFTERSRGKLIHLLENYLFETDRNESFFHQRLPSFQWREKNKASLYEKNISSHQIEITLSEDTLLFLYPQKTLNEGLKEINQLKSNIKITKPDNISKTLLAVCGDLLSAIPPMEFKVQ